MNKLPTELISAAKAVIERLDSPLWKGLPHTSEHIHRLRKAIEGMDDDLEATLKAGYPPKDGKIYSAFFKAGDDSNILRGPYEALIYWSGFDWRDIERSIILTEQPDYWSPLPAHLKTLNKPFTTPQASDKDR